MVELRLKLVAEAIKQKDKHMANGNGSKWIRWGIGLLITIFLFIGTNVVANDKASRKRDTDLKDTHDKDMRLIENKLHKNQLEMIKTLTRIETKISSV